MLVFVRVYVYEPLPLYGNPSGYKSKITSQWLPSAVFYSLQPGLGVSEVRFVLGRGVFQ
jgi:hypothetical protein